VYDFEHRAEGAGECFEAFIGDIEGGAAFNTMKLLPQIWVRIP